MTSITNKPWLQYLVVIVTPIVGMALGAGIAVIFGITHKEYGNLIVNLFFLFACFFLLRIFKLSSQDAGLKIIKEKIETHLYLSLIVFVLYMLFYIFIIRISSLKPISANTIWGLVTFLVVVLAEELYFRGIFFSFIEKRFSAKTALVFSSLFFGLLHASQGLSAFVSRIFTGWLWGSIRYSSGMIFLLIFPIHFAYNSIWLLFEGNWGNPPPWVIYALPAAEFLLGLAFVILRDKQSRENKNEIE